jgi:prepilin-type N-terminal cleavage/methylation domain-containing protein
MRSTARASQKGFTLIEILVTLAATTIALLGILSTIKVTGRANLESQRASEALGLAEGMVEIVRGMTVAQFETQPMMHVSDGRIAAQPTSNCPHAAGPAYGAIGSTVISGSEQSWVNGGAGGGCDDTTWREWHEGPIRGATNVEFRRGVRFGVVEADLVWIQVIVEWTNEGAKSGANNGLYDRSITMEVVRSRFEAPP